MHQHVMKTLNCVLSRPKSRGNSVVFLVMFSYSEYKTICDFSDFSIHVFLCVILPVPLSQIILQGKSYWFESCIFISGSYFYRLNSILSPTKYSFYKTFQGFQTWLFSSFSFCLKNIHRFEFSAAVLTFLCSPIIFILISWLGHNISHNLATQNNA